MDVSVLINTWNNAQSLQRTLESVSRLHIPSGLNWELVIVNNGCTDNTDEIIAHWKNRLPVVYVKEQRQGISYARNTAIKTAQGKLFIFTDDDVYIPPYWLGVYWRNFQSMPTNYYFGGPVRCLYEQKPPKKELMEVAPYSVKGLNWGADDKKLEGNEIFLGGNWACPAQAIRNLKGFNTSLGLKADKQLSIGEEREIMNRLQREGLTPYYLVDAELTHFVPGNKCKFKHIMQRKEAEGIADGFEHEIILQGKAIAGVPLWMIKKLVSRYFQYISARLCGKKGYAAYASYAYLKGQIGTLHKK